ncbi:MAG: hypothetical protein F6K42_18860 [Leptolyngbya sp. SIO1D8]|nr:hypothetical protein [Leptolyngbya sp. SIO1D8]
MTSTIFQAVAAMPLANAVKKVNPKGFEPLRKAEGYFVVAYNANEAAAIHQSMAHPSTPVRVVRQWAVHKELWIPVAWCEEVTGDCS